MLHKSDFLFFRHGVTAFNTKRILQGRIDIELSPEGKQQAGYLAKWLATKEITQIYTSPLIRATQTAQIIINRGYLKEYYLKDELIERNYGQFDGMTRDQLCEARELLGLSNIDPTQDWHGCTFVESDDEIWHRVHRLLVEIGKSGGPSLFITHAGVMKSVLYSILNIPNHQKLCFNIPNGCVIGIRQTDVGFQVVEMYPDLSIL